MPDASTQSLSQIYDSLAHWYAGDAGINEFLTMPLVQHFCPPGAKSALEVCCGVGRNAIELSKQVESVWGIDLSHEMIATARRQSEGITNPPHFVQGDLLAYDFGGQTFDYVYGAYFITYFDADALLQKLVSLTHPGSRLLILDGLLGPGQGKFRVEDILRQAREYVHFMRRHGMPGDYVGWFLYRLRRRAFLDSNDWKRVERWKREHSLATPRVTWGEQFREMLPDAKIEYLPPRLACAIWDRK
jgi:ubiquinone/menaquinone biosynthesis C-methylase UbiE